jgi:protein gp37
MGKETNISWCHSTFNPWRGCTRWSSGCKFCYAETLSNRNPAVLGVWGPGGTRVVASEAKWREPLGWDRDAAKANARRRVFSASFSDVFEQWDGPMVDAKGRPLDWDYKPIDFASRPGPLTMNHVRARLFKLILDTPNLDWLLLTKRPESIVDTIERTSRVCGNPTSDALHPGWVQNLEPFPNVWLGTTVEDRKAKDRIDILRDIPARVRFLSVEPLIEDLGDLDLTGIHQVIVGGESGHKARSFDVAWARSIRDQCREQGVAFFMKQCGSHPIGSHNERLRMVGEAERRDDATVRWKLGDGHGGDWQEWPVDLRVREIPNPEATHA